MNFSHKLAICFLIVLNDYCYCLALIYIYVSVKKDDSYQIQVMGKEYNVIF